MPEQTRENLSGRVLGIRSLIAYQPGAVVSRMLVYKSAGTITLFAFDAGEGLSEHTAPYDAVAMGLEGEAKITIAGEECVLGEGEMIIMPAHIPHAVEARTQFKMVLTMIHA
jgi:quercetin dioxygenase-like cupin family protein